MSFIQRFVAATGLAWLSFSRLKSALSRRNAA